MNPEQYKEKLESLRGKLVTVFIADIPVTIEGEVRGGLLPAQPFLVSVYGEAKGQAQVTLDPAHITSLQILPHQTIIDLKY